MKGSPLSPSGMSNRSPKASDASMTPKGGHVDDNAVRSTVATAAKTMPDPNGNRTG